MTLISNDTDKVPLKKAVENVGERYLGTDINAGLRGGFDQLVADDLSDNNKFAILLTDGEHNQGAYNPQSHLQFRDKGWPVYTIGLGAGVDMSLLGQIASETGGQCVNQCQPLTDPTLLQSLYFDIINKISRGKITHASTFTMQQGETRQIPVSVPANQASATFLTTWPGSEVKMSLVSPSGQQITPISLPKESVIFASDLDGDYDIYTLNLDGANLRSLTNNTVADTTPAWSPDGTKILFTQAQGTKDQLFQMDADGSNLQQILVSDFNDRAPIWSPNDTRIAFTRLGDINSTGELRSDIYVMNSDGTSVSRLTMSTEKTGQSLDAARLPTWSADGRYILFTWYRQGRDQVWMMESDGSNQQPILADSYSNYGAAMSPDGHQIVFTSTRNGAPELYLMGKDISGIRRLTNTVGFNDAPQWSSDGYRIVFTTTRAGRSQLFWMKPDGTQQYSLTAPENNSYWVSWQPGIGADADVYYAQGTTYVLYTVPTPETGQWVINLYGESLDVAGEIVEIRVSTQSLINDVFLPIVRSSAGSATTLNDTDTKISYSSYWGHSRNRGLGNHQDDVHYTATNSMFFEYTFTGTGVAIISEFDPNYGSADVYIDGAQVATVSAVGSKRNDPQRVLFSTTSLSPGVHTIKVVKRSGAYLVLDAITVFRP